jgi:CheY-like chemotaxis protein
MEAIGQLSGGVAHDFNNLLAVISNNISLLESDKVFEAPQVEIINDIKLAVERAASLTRQLLTFSRRQHFQPRNIDLNGVVSNLGMMIRRILGEHINVRLKPADVPALVFADTTMVEQIMLNIVVNSRDAMPKGGELVITVSHAEVDAATAAKQSDARAGDFCVLTISDNGNGIPPEILPRIFEPFFTTKEPGKGTGLGLATVYGIVRQHQGWINVRSRPNNGTTFEIFLPALPKNSTIDKPSSKEADIRGGTETLLVVEDEPALRKLLVAGLMKKGYQVLEYSSGAEAWQHCSKQLGKIHLLVTDIVMPGGMNGHELAQRMQSRHPKLKVIFTSGYDPEQGELSPKLVEGVNFLAKPFSLPDLSRCVRTILDSK